MADYNYNLPQMINSLEQDLRQYISKQSISDPLMVGIHTSGVWLARELAERLAFNQAVYELDVSFYRDDFDRIGLPKQTQPSRLPINITGKHILLVDDVLHSGRTVRAAMNELFDYGRPASIHLVVLIARGNRELPIEAQVCALREEPGREFFYHFEGPEPLSLHLIRVDGE